MTIDRRQFVVGGLAGGIALGAGACIPPDQSPAGRLAATLRIIEAEAGGTLGVELFDTGTGLSVGLNRSMRFGHASSFKTSLAAMVLARDTSGLASADRRVTWASGDLLSVSPFTTARLSEGATLRELAEAMQKTSDNTAANILLAEVGGPEELTVFWRMLDDQVSRLDRTEPALNNVPVAEVRDTTTPAAMARTLAGILYGDVLPPAAREMLRQWMVETETGLRRVRAGLPEDWRAGDKTGTSTWPGMGGLTVDIGFAEPPGRPAVTFATYFRGRATAEADIPAAEAALAKVGKVLTDFVRGRRILGI